AALGGQRQPDAEARRDTQGAAVADDDGVEIGAVAAAGVAGVVDVTAAPALAGFVVGHGAHHVLVDGAGLG
nr:hypothetical protein [Tanacetum cinerariifolium]